MVHVLLMSLDVRTCFYRLCLFGDELDAFKQTGRLGVERERMEYFLPGGVLYKHIFSLNKQSLVLFTSATQHHLVQVRSPDGLLQQLVLPLLLY